MMLRALLTIGAVQVITMLVLLARTKTIAVAFGPETVGVMAVIDKLLAVIAQTASLSLPFAAARFLPEQWAAGPAAYADLFRRMRNVVLGMAIVAMTIALALTIARPSIWGDALLPWRDALVVALLGLPVVALLPFLQNAIAGRMQQNRAMAVGLAHAVVMLLAIVGLAGWGLSGFYAAYALLGTLLVTAVTGAALRGLPTEPAGPALTLPKPVLHFALSLLLLAFLTPYAALFVHYEVLRIHGAQAAGWMQAAIGISLAVRAVLGSAHAVFLTPNLNRGGTPAERLAWAHRFQMTFCLIAGVAVPPLVLFPGLAVNVLYSPEFVPATVFVAVFVLAEILGMLSGTYQTFVMAQDHLRFHLASNLIAQLAVAGLAIGLVGPFGILGAGIATFAAPLLLIVSTVAFLRRHYDFSLPRPVASRMAWLAFALVACGVAGAAFPRDDLWTVMLKAAGYAVVVVGLVVGLSDDERARAEESWVRLRKKWSR